MDICWLKIHVSFRILHYRSFSYEKCQECLRIKCTQDKNDDDADYDEDEKRMILKAFQSRSVAGRHKHETSDLEASPMAVDLVNLLTNHHHLNCHLFLHVTLTLMVLSQS